MSDKPVQLQLLSGTPKATDCATQCDCGSTGAHAWHCPMFPKRPVQTQKESKRDAQFKAFHTNNPHVYALLVKLARAAKAKGARHLGMKNLYEVARWEHWMQTADFTSDFKLNNNYTSRYARLIMQQEPDLRDLFETRKLTT